ncbi:hypothetical protein H6F78_02320 [Coleofasciculus sp. FACHB-64]|nr:MULTISPECIES: hypothetical protein [unclassified Coleofasciculus]MBD1837944.1 hypothetical protein [Coleofasciculus sp. FACHB-501]MBD1881939.1 hypothetical protein [Coleofasciculus sp. FACHB-T130]MBD1887831.1 hypothetical protein [Coleofasciculus sp. FACHB-SPT9]MBD1893973.1 hypothetical protein [Coleofasciculus sp. FACHB-129]MBD1901580.1 hypothetical protein [Coleofasciculus sp. FACHB-125]
MAIFVNSFSRWTGYTLLSLLWYSLSSCGAAYTLSRNFQTILFKSLKPPD